ncbi:transcriptional regulator ATRX homolog [Monomorium pharaonis]|uniref:transcriptional regulator ATRX homolog n=1 Tax=Monomorium pharaonis TaxID=307658 RepID=UPI00063F626C|nr:transcriptional regulator ATRX homolog [Monomorium pharaonis]
MSRSFTLNQNKSRKRVTIATLHASTPNKCNISPNQCNITLSEISSFSSEEKDRRVLLMQNLTQKHKKLTKEKKRINLKRILKDSDNEWKIKQKELINESLNEKKKKNLENEEKAVKKRRIVTQVKDIDNEWETESEKPINELSIDSQKSILIDNYCVKLFENPCTPEKTREAPKAYEEILPESPILSSRRRTYVISKKNNIILQNESLPVNLLPIEVPNPEQTNEDEIIVDNAETNVPSQKSKESRKQYENLSSSICSPATIVMRRNPTDKLYPGKTFRFQYFTASSFDRTPNKFDFKRKLPKVPRKKKNISISPGMSCISKYWDKTLQKWIERRYGNDSSEGSKNDKHKTKTKQRNKKKQKRKMIAFRPTFKQKCNDTSDDNSFQDLENGTTKAIKKTTKPQKKKKFLSTQKQRYDVHDVYGTSDVEFETGGQDGKRISFREFCQRQKIDKNISSM